MAQTLARIFVHVRQREGDDSGQKLQEATQTGRPWGDEKFVKDLENRAGGKLREGTPGHRSKQQAQAAAPSPK